MALIYKDVETVTTGHNRSGCDTTGRLREISILEFAATEYGRKGKVAASEDVKEKIASIGINKCARESGFDRKNFIRKLIRGQAVKRNSYREFERWLKKR